MEVIVGFVGLGDDMQDVQAVQCLMQNSFSGKASDENNTTVASAVIPPHQEAMEEAPLSSTEERADFSMDESSAPVSPEEVLPAGTEEVQRDQMLQVSLSNTVYLSPL